MLSDAERAEALRLRAEIREDFRREIERHVEPQRTAARDPDKSAIAFAQSAIKTATLLNGGALVAIPAGVALFGIDATAVMRALFLAAGLFVGGLVAALLASMFGFLALAQRVAMEDAVADGTQESLNNFYYPRDDDEAERQKKIATQTKEVEQIRRSVRHHRSMFLTCSGIGVFFLCISLVAFVCGSGKGGWTVLHAPLKPVGRAASVAPPCKDGSQTCNPWERDWSNSEIEPGSTMTREGIVQPPLRTPPN
jgi:hypothetical protein